MPRPTVSSASRIALLVGAWVLLVCVGFAWLIRYKTTPGEVDGRPPQSWPAESRVRPQPGRANLLLFAHPRCACTHATVSELARLMPMVADRVSVTVVVVRPSGVDAEWDDTELVRRIATIPGARVEQDDDGVEAHRFHAVVSGMTVLYDATATLRFAGGITSSRGHEGDSFGRRRILDVRPRLTTLVAPQRVASHQAAIKSWATATQ